MTDPRLAQLIAAAPGLRLTAEPADLEHYGRDWTRRWTPAPLAVALPARGRKCGGGGAGPTAHRVACGALGRAHGALGRRGGGQRGDCVLSLERMNRCWRSIRWIADKRAAGIALESVHRAAADTGCATGGFRRARVVFHRRQRRHQRRRHPRDPLRPHREWIAGLKVVTGGGELLDLNRGLGEETPAATTCAT
jgi:hypothetical protein